MSIKRVLAPPALVACAALAVVAAPATALASPGPSDLPQPASALSGATWLANQLTPGGYMPSQTTPGTADLSATANTILALASAGVDPAGTSNALSYMEGQVDSYVPQGGADGPGQLALLILDAHALGASPTSFGGNNLVARLLATEQTTGVDVGLFGTESQVANSLAGVYDQGLALAALAAAGITAGPAVSAAESWLVRQQCPDGGWTSYENSSNPCNGSPAVFVGPDTNSTALAVQGLSAEGVLGSRAANKALRFLGQSEDSDGGWGYEPNSAAAAGSTDPDSTALVIQAILAMGKAPNKATFVRGAANPVSALESFQLPSGSGSGAFTFPGISGPNTIATYQAVPAVADVLFPFNLKVTTPSLPTGSVGQRYGATLAGSGGRPPYRWTILKGIGTGLPTGLRLNRATGVIAGTPRSAGTFSFVVEITDMKTTTLPRTSDVAWKVFFLTT